MKSMPKLLCNIGIGMMIVTAALESSTFNFLLTKMGMSTEQITLLWPITCFAAAATLQFINNSDRKGK